MIHQYDRVLKLIFSLSRSDPLLYWQPPYKWRLLFKCLIIALISIRHRTELQATSQSASKCNFLFNCIFAGCFRMISSFLVLVLTPLIHESWSWLYKTNRRKAFDSGKIAFSLVFSLMSCLIFIIRIRDYKHDHWALFKCEICNRCNDNKFFCFSWNTFLSLLKSGFWLDLAHSSFIKHTHTHNDCVVNVSCS